MAADGSVVIEIVGDESKFKKTLHGLGDMASSAIGGVATAVSAAGTAIAGLGAGAVKVGSEFEAALAGTSTMFGGVDVDTAGLTSQILELSSASGLAAADITGSLYNALSAGVPVTEDMGGAMNFMESAAKLAAAGFTDVDTAVTATAKVMNAYGMTLDDTDAIQKIMLQTQNKGITTVGELGASLAQVTPTAAAMGVSFENVGAALATMTAQGTPTAQATTQLNSLIAELGKNGTTAANNLMEAAEGTEYAGMSFGELMDAGVPVNEVLDLMAGYAEDNGLSMIDMFSSIEAGKAALAMAGENSEAFAENLAAMSTEADVVGDAYAKVTDTFEHSISVLKESTKNLGIAVYEGMKEPLKEAAKLATGWVGEIADAFSEGGLTGAVGALGDVLARAITKLSSFAPKMIQAGAGLIRSLLAGIQNNLPELTNGAVGILGAFAEGVIFLLPDLANVAMQLITSLVEGIAMALPELLPAAADTIASLVQGFVDNMPMLILAALQLITGLANGLIAAVPTLIAALPAIITSLVNGLLASIPQIIQTGVSLLSALITNLPIVISTIVAVLPEIISSIITTLLDNIPEIIQAGVDLLTSLISNLPTIITTVVKAVPEIVSGLTSAFTDNIPQIIQAGVELLISLISDLPSIIATIVTAVPEIVAGIVGAFGDLFGDMVDAGYNLITGIWQGISDAAGWLWGLLKGWCNNLVAKIKNFFGIKSPSKVMAEVGKYLDMGLAEGLDRYADVATNAAGDVSDAVSKELSKQQSMPLAVDEEAGALASRMRAVVDTESGSIGAHVQMGAGSGSSGDGRENPEADNTPVIEELRAIREEVEKGHVIVMDHKTVGRAVSKEQGNAARASGRGAVPV